MDRAAWEGEHWRAASHRLDQHEAEGFIPLNREQKSARVGQQRVLAREISFADVFDLVPIEEWHDFLFPVVAEERLDFARQLEPYAGAAGGGNRQVRALARRHAAEKGNVLLFLIRHTVLRYRNAVMHDADARHWFSPREPLGNRNVTRVRVTRVLLGQFRFVRMVDRQNS